MTKRRLLAMTLTWRWMTHWRPRWTPSCSQQLVSRKLQDWTIRYRPRLNSHQLFFFSSFLSRRVWDICIPPLCNCFSCFLQCFWACLWGFDLFNPNCRATCTLTNVAQREGVYVFGSPSLKNLIRCDTFQQLCKGHFKNTPFKCNMNGQILHWATMSFCEPAEGNFTHICSPEVLPVNNWLLSKQVWGRSGLLDLLLAAITLTGMSVITLIKRGAIPLKDILLCSLCSETVNSVNAESLFSLKAPFVLLLYFEYADIHPVPAGLLSVFVLLLSF